VCGPSSPLSLLVLLVLTILPNFFCSLLHDAFDLFACLENERALTKQIKEERQTKFSILLRLLPKTAPPTLAGPAERKIRNDIWASSLSLINRILTAATDLHDRIELRNDFQILGIDDTFNVS
jgi:hypothetical protein